MSMLSSNSSSITTNNSKTILLSEVVQLAIVLMLGVIYLVEILHGKSPDNFISGALVSVVSYYFGARSTVVATNALNNALTTATNNSNTTTPTN